MRFAHATRKLFYLSMLSRCVIFPTSKPSRPSPLLTRAIKVILSAPDTLLQSLSTHSSEDLIGSLRQWKRSMVPEPLRRKIVSRAFARLFRLHISWVMKNTRVIDLGPDTEDKKQQVPRLTDFNRKPLNGSVDFNGNGGVVTRYRLAFGSPYMRVDVINANATLANEGPSPAQISGMPDLGANFTLSKRTFLGTNLIGMVPTSNSTYVPRTVSTDTVVLSWDGTLVPIGSIGPIFQVPGGHYKILIRALRVNGNPYTDADFDYWVSPPISVLGSPVVQRPTTPQPPSPPASARAQAPPTSQPHVGL
ncbi:hypothetical protein PSTG_00910 [Puccinia striiformis f. sp. tritici PST-78]|uniref:Uncharacterized protein n=1 Tax=Puccinia striiformis f. sp. tritici PST-78 TaxID=1165861 RepID=A0A0L0W2Z9_9BASI|nr:hypothetical protein PSTG_00910 [Puccinia striiformis f. sp. tritici PST-78]